MDEKTHLLICDCSSPEHQLIFRYHPDDRWGELFISVHLADYSNFFQRLIAGIRYIFGYRSRYGEFDELVVSKKHISKLVEFLGEYLKIKKEKKEE